MIYLSINLLKTFYFYHEIAENKIAGSVVGQIRVIDPNLSDNHEIKILSVVCILICWRMDD